MAAVTAEAQVDTEEFFAELNKGQRFVETMIDGRTVELYLHTPHIEDVLRASDLFDALNADLEDKETIRGRLMRLACRSCIRGVDGENVVAFLSVFPPIPSVVIACLKLLRVEDDDMRRVGIDPDVKDHPECQEPA